MMRPRRATRRHGLQRRLLHGDLAQEYLVHLPSGWGPDSPLVVSIHGRARNADEHARLLAAYCEMHTAVLVVPNFSAEHHPDYQRLGRLGRGKRADLALNSIVDEVIASTGLSAERFHLFGFSAGAQFAHRYAMVHPQRIAKAVVASAGWYTFPIPARRFPHGTRPSPHLPGVIFDAEEYLAVPITVVAGTDDVDAGRVRRTERLDREQGTTRRARARNWVAAMQVAAEAHQMEPRVRLEKLPGCGVRFRRAMLRAGLADSVFDLLLGSVPSDPED